MRVFILISLLTATVYLGYINGFSIHREQPVPEIAAITHVASGEQASLRPATSTPKKLTPRPQKVVVRPSTSPSIQQASVLTPSSTPRTAPEPPPVAEAPIASTTLSNDFIIQVEAQVLSFMNQERVRNGLSALSPDSALADIARMHSEDMPANNYFAHISPAGCSMSCRLDNAGYLFRSAGENLYTMTGYRLSAVATAQKIVDGWMNSPGHRANILGPSFTHAGAGLAIEGSTIYATANFSLPR